MFRRRLTVGFVMAVVLLSRAGAEPPAFVVSVPSPPPATTGDLDETEAEAFRAAMGRVKLVGRLGMGPARSLVVRDTKLYYGSTTGLTIFDVSRPSSPHPVGFVPIPGEVSGLDINGDFAYVAAGLWGLQVVDLSALRVVGTYRPAGLLDAGDDTTLSVAVSGSLAVLGTRGGRMVVVDVSSPYQPIEVSRAGDHGMAERLTITGARVHAARFRNFQVFDVSNPASPKPLGDLTFASGGWALDLLADRDTVHLLTHEDLLSIDVSDPHAPPGSPARPLDVSSPSRPVLVSWYDSGYYYDARALRRFGNRLYAVATRGLFVLDASDPSRLTLEAWYPETEAVDVHVAKDLVYLTTYHGVTVLALP
jgi:hypothetical protein